MLFNEKWHKTGLLMYGGSTASYFGLKKMALVCVSDILHPYVVFLPAFMLHIKEVSPYYRSGIVQQIQS